jgi:hypothetical protein
MRTRRHCDLLALPLPNLQNTLTVHKDAVRPPPISVVAQFAGYADAMRGVHDLSNLLRKKWCAYFIARRVATKGPESASV